MKQLYWFIILLVGTTACAPAESNQPEASAPQLLPSSTIVTTPPQKDSTPKAPQAGNEPVEQAEVPPPPPDFDWYGDSLNCALTRRLSAKARSAIFPFSRAKTVKVLSYKGRVDVDETVPIIENGKIVLKQPKEEITLSHSQVDSLTHILYNFTYKGKPLIQEISLCIFTPRNAIVLLDEQQQAFAYLEICFACKQFVTVPQRFRTGDFCLQKYELLKSFFKQAGITYGLEEPLDEAIQPEIIPQEDTIVVDIHK